MKKKLLVSLLLAGALIVSPLGQAFAITATASSNNSVPTSSTTVSTPAPTPAEVWTKNVVTATNEIKAAKSGDVVKIEKSSGINCLSKDYLKELSAKSDVSVEMSYVYEGVEYHIVIPAGGVIVDENISYYGPLYLYALYGANGVVANGGYTVVPGDTLSSIAAKNNTTVMNLLALNPQIQNPNIIALGQVIKVR